MSASPFQDYKAQEWYIIISFDRPPALWAMGAGPHQGLATGDTIDADVKKAPDHRSKHK